MTTITLDDRGVATVLAALRMYQSEMEAEGEAFFHGFISTDGGTLEPMDVAEIDALAEQINAPREDERQKPEEAA